MKIEMSTAPDESCEVMKAWQLLLSIIILQNGIFGHLKNVKNQKLNIRLNCSWGGQKTSGITSKSRTIDYPNESGWKRAKSTTPLSKLIVDSKLITSNEILKWKKIKASFVWRCKTEITKTFMQSLPSTFSRAATLSISLLQTVSKR